MDEDTVTTLMMELMLTVMGWDGGDVDDDEKVITKRVKDYPR